MDDSSRFAFGWSGKLLLVLASTIILPGPVGLMTIFFCLTTLGVMNLHGQWFGFGNARAVRSRSRTSKLLLVLASTVVLGFVSRRDPWPNIPLLQDHLYVWKWGGVSFSTRGWFVFLCRRHICRTVIYHECTPFTERSGKGIYTLSTPYTLCHFTTMNNIYARHTQDVC
jgi:hypothetical protein